MIGGNERRWALEVDDPERRQRLELSVAAYDQGYQYERELTSRNASTYNRINRLTSRVLLDADVLRRPGGDPDVLAELAVAESILVEQVASERMGDPWGYADLGLVRLLRGLSASEAYRELDRMRPQRFVYESALATLRPLARAAGSLLPEIEAAVRYLELAARAARD